MLKFLGTAGLAILYLDWSCCPPFQWGKLVKEKYCSLHMTAQGALIMQKRVLLQTEDSNQYKSIGYIHDVCEQKILRSDSIDA